MQYMIEHAKGTTISSLAFLVLVVMYGMVIEGKFDFLSLPFLFIFAFPIYFFIANPLTCIIRYLLRRKLNQYHFILLFIIMLISFLFQYQMAAVNSNLVTLAGQDYLLVILFSFITAFPSIFGIEPADN